MDQSKRNSSVTDETEAAGSGRVLSINVGTPRVIEWLGEVAETSIWKAAGYKTRAEYERWKRNTRNARTRPPTRTSSAFYSPKNLN